MTSDPPRTTGDASPKPPAHDASVKETLIAILISLTIALAARSYATEAFIIPTGSMAPTLYGAHLNYRFSESGAEWATDVWARLSESQDNVANPNQIVDGRRPVSSVPMSASVTSDRARSRVPAGAAEGVFAAPLSYHPSAGDRILVHKYLYHMREPRRFDVVVFKSPEEVKQNFIKRLIGLPSEAVWLAGGDVFSTTDVVARLDDGRTIPPPDDRWSIRRKPERIQRDLWRPVYSSEYAPLSNAVNGRRWFSCPWSGDDWVTRDEANDRELQRYRCEADGPTVLKWDSVGWPVTDWVWYNEIPRMQKEMLPVSDVRVRAGVEPDRDGLKVGVTIRARGHEFRAAIEGSRARILMRAIGAGGEGAWAEMASAEVGPLRGGTVTNIEFWHADQALSLFVGRKRVAYAEYNWGPSERLLHATGYAGTEYAQGGAMEGVELDRTEVYERDFPEIEWDFSGSALTLHRVGVDHDVYYRPDTHYGSDEPGFGTHPDNLAIIGPDQFFCCGDNSPASSDCRMWRSVHPQVLAQFKDTRGSAWEESEMKLRGIVPRELMLGKAYFVYFPAPFSINGKIPIPNIAEMRAIR